MQHILAALLSSGLLLCAPLPSWCEDSDTQAAATDGQAQIEHWLEEVKAQRKAWESQRNAAKQASNERLRMIDPWGAARLQTLEQASDLRREALLNRSDNLRKHAEAQFEARRHAYESWLQQQERRHSAYQPYGWDNRWYYRGY